MKPNSPSRQLDRCLLISWPGKRARITIGGYPAISLKEVRVLRDEARALPAKGVNLQADRKRQQHVVMLADEHRFMAVYERWLAHRSLYLEKEGRQSTPRQIGRIFRKDVIGVDKPPSRQQSARC